MTNLLTTLHASGTALPPTVSRTSIRVVPPTRATDGQRLVHTRRHDDF